MLLIVGFLIVVSALILSNIIVLVLIWSFFSGPPDFNDLVVTQGTLTYFSECKRKGRSSAITIAIYNKQGEVKESISCNVNMDVLKESIDDHIEVRRGFSRLLKGSLWHVESSKGVIFSYKDKKEWNQSIFMILLQLLLFSSFTYYNAGFVKGLYKWLDNKVGCSKDSGADGV